MSTVTANVRMRDGAANTAACLVETFNAVHALILSSGMTAVSTSDYTGQAGTFSESSGVGLTQVVKNAASISDVYCGYKVYKHPTLTLYLLVSYVDTNQSSAAASSFGRMRFQLSTKLNGSGGFDPTKTSNAFFSTDIMKSISGSYTVSLGYYPATYEKMTVSCGTDHFWISRDYGIEAYNMTSYFGLPLRVDINSFGVFASLTDPTILCVVLPQYDGNIYSSRPAGFTTTTVEQSSLRYWLCNKGAWSYLDNGAAGQLDNPRMTSTLAGIRVAQGKLVVSSAYHRFNFGFIPHKALNSFSTATMNITGVAAVYQALPYMGFANHSPPTNDYLNMSSLVFPTVT